MDFYNINEWFWGLPNVLHILTWTVMIAIYSHLIFGFWMVRHKLPKHVVKYFLIRTLVITFLLFMKTDAMLDLFLPMYLFSYFDGLIILNGFGLYRCKNMKQAFKKVTNFQSKKI